MQQVNVCNCASYCKPSRNTIIGGVCLAPSITKHASKTSSNKGTTKTHSECGRMRLCRNEDTRYTKWDLSTGGYKFTVSRVTNVISGETCRSRSCDKSWSVDTITVCRFAINGLSTSTKKVAKGASHMPLKLQMGLDAIGNLWASARMRKVPV